MHHKLLTITVLDLALTRRGHAKAITTAIIGMVALTWLAQFACDRNSDKPQHDTPSQQGKADTPIDARNTKDTAAIISEPPQEPPVDSRPGKAGMTGLNIIALSPQLISGAVPEQPADFAMLANHGIKTIISVDGAQPDLENAQRFDMRYVHLPIGYHGIDRDRQLEIARAVRDLPGPIYVHCHHGKHRGPAAAASAAVALGIYSPERAVEFMRHAGTSNNYAGLYQSVSTLKQVEEAELDMAPTLFPETAPVPGFVKAMAELSHAFDHLKDMRAADWQAPPHHPDLEPLAEAGRLENLLRALRDDDESEKYPPDFTQRMNAAWTASVEFEKMLAEGKAGEDLSMALDRVGQSCRACHTVHRNQK